jgi:hypothetical protein
MAIAWIASSVSDQVEMGRLNADWSEDSVQRRKMFFSGTSEAGFLHLYTSFLVSPVSSEESSSSEAAERLRAFDPHGGEPLAGGSSLLDAESVWGIVSPWR